MQLPVHSFTIPGGQADDKLEAAVLAHCRRELPNFMVPARVIASDTLPHNQNGKVDRRALADQYENLFRE